MPIVCVHATAFCKDGVTGMYICIKPMLNSAFQANIDATPWWHETVTLPTQPLVSKGSPSMQATGGHDFPTDQSHLSSSDEDQSQLPSGLQKKWRRPSAGPEESGVTWQGGQLNGVEHRSHESMGRRSVGNDMTPLQYTIDCSPEVITNQFLYAYIYSHKNHVNCNSPVAGY